MTPILPLTPMIALLFLAACKDTTLPNLSVPLSEHTSFGTDLANPHPSLGITITDPLHRIPR